MLCIVYRLDHVMCYTQVISLCRNFTYRDYNDVKTFSLLIALKVITMYRDVRIISVMLPGK